MHQVIGPPPGTAREIPRSESAPAEFPDSIQYGLLTLKAPPDFRPDHPGAGLPNVIRYPQAGLSVALGPLLNASAWSQDTGRWAVVADNGSLHFVAVCDDERPQFPDALPGSCEPWPGSRYGAHQAAAERNAERLRFAVVPLEWTIAVRNLRHPRFAPPRPPGLELPAAVAALIQELPIDLQARATGTPGEFSLMVSQTIHITDSKGDVGGDLAAALDFLADETDQAATAIRQRLTLPASPLRGPHTRPGEVAATPVGLDVG